MPDLISDAMLEEWAIVGTRDEMVGKGWIAEGDGPDRIVMCAP